MRKFLLFGVAAMMCGAWLSAEVRTAPSPVRMKQSRQPRSAQGPSEQDVAVVRRVFDDLFNNGSYGVAGTICARSCTVHTGNRSSTLEDTVAEGKGWRAAAPDLHMTINQVMTRGKRVVVTWTATGTHTGSGNGLQPSGKHLVVHGRSEFRVVDGKITEVWNHWNRDALYRQVGVNPKLGRLIDTARDVWSAVEERGAELLAR